MLKPLATKPTTHSHFSPSFLQINLDSEVVLEEEEEEGGTVFLRFLVEFGFRSRLEDVLDGKGEGPAKGSEVEERDDDSDDAVEDSRSQSSLPKITVFSRFHHLQTTTDLQSFN